jgi:hypothetical protein
MLGHSHNRQLLFLQDKLSTWVRTIAVASERRSLESLFMIYQSNQIMRIAFLEKAGSLNELGQDTIAKRNT